MASSKLIVRGGTGLTSCLSVRLDQAVAFWKKKGSYPSKIDGSEQFLFYQDYEGQVVVDEILDTYRKNSHLPEVNFNHGHQYGYLDELHLETLSHVALNICPPSDRVLEKADEFKKRIEGRTSVLYRGNDKSHEIIRTPYTAMGIMAKESGAEKFIVQTDEEEFYQWFKERFPDTICFEEIPRINKNPDSYVMPEMGKRVDFAVNFFAAIIAISSCEKVILNTGNNSLWVGLFRGTEKGVYQWHGNNNTYKKF